MSRWWATLRENCWGAPYVSYPAAATASAPCLLYSILRLSLFVKGNCFGWNRCKKTYSLEILNSYEGTHAFKIISNLPENVFRMREEGMSCFEIPSVGSHMRPSPRGLFRTDSPTRRSNNLCNYNSDVARNSWCGTSHRGVRNCSFSVMEG